ncbi:hypothetical protein FQN49_002327 [Arthroderma sp. PD_2]|nr:hypothetical protein FQN49_002327 [Arthroderma sp. PD_2]
MLEITYIIETKTRSPPVRSENENTSIPTPEVLGLSPSTVTTIPSSSRSDRLLPAGYLGPTSFVAALEEDGESISSTTQQPQGGPEFTAIYSSIPQSWWMQRAAEAIGHLKEFSIMKDLIHNYCNISQSLAIAAPLVFNALAQIEITCNENLSDTTTNEQILALTGLVVKNTGQAFDIPATVNGTNFHELYTGTSLRLEIIGIIYALAGRASYFGLSHNTFLDSTNSVRDAKFPRKMLAASDTVIQVCRNLAPANDLTLWLLHENLLLSGVILGDSSSVTWYRVGELATHIFELGLHRDDDNSARLPTFLLESRRRLFAAFYQFDKGIATFLGRPPRISWRHSDCPLPLDISDEALAGNDNELETARGSLTAEGWSVSPVFQRAAWIRLRFIISTFREEILELSLQKPGMERLDQLRDVSRRCDEAWNSLPEHLRYAEGCWDTDLVPSVKLMLVISYMAYLHNGFLVQSLLVEDCANARADLLDISATILSTVLTFGRQRERSFDIQRDFIWTLLLFGFSSASVLIRALQRQARTRQPILYRGSRSTLIRNLSVFISHLESMARPGSASFSFFSRATDVFSRIITEVLEPDSVEGLHSGLSTEVSSDIDTSLFLDMDGVDLFDPTNIANIFDQMLCEL